MADETKRTVENPEDEPQTNEVSQFDRAPRQKNEDRDPVRSAEDIREVPLQHGTLK